MIQMFEITREIKLFAFDLDGTLYIGEKTVAGAFELLSYLREKYQIVFFTNNSTKTVGEVHEKLGRLGIECQLGEIYTSSLATAVYLRDASINNLYVIGSQSLCSELEGNGLRIEDSDSAENLVVGLDFDINYDKIARALSVLRKGGKFIVCNEDSSFPVGENRFLPGCGAMVGAISAAAKRRPDFVVGKPNTYILSKVAKDFGVNNHGIMVVGDSYESDIMMALSYGCKAILISCNGIGNNEDVVIMGNLNELLEYVRRVK